MTTSAAIKSEPEQLVNVCEDLKIVAVSKRSAKPAPEHFAAGSHSWKVTLAYGKRRLTTGFYQGPAHTEAPTAADVLSCLVSDMYAGEQSFEDFASDMGLDTDSRKAEATWKACAKMAPKVRKFLGDAFKRCQNAEH